MAGQFEGKDSERAQSRLEALGITIPSVLGRSALGEDTQATGITGEALIDCQDMHDALGNVPRTYQDGAVYDLNTGRRII